MFFRFPKPKGVSMTIVVGLVALLMLTAVAANELIIRALNSAYQIESSNRAYFAAEGGIEDALYELTPHYAGYETPGLAANARTGDFKPTGTNVNWYNRWEVKNISNAASFSGVISSDRKLVVPLFNDQQDAGDPCNGATPPKNCIATSTPSIKTLDLSDFKIEFSIPTMYSADMGGSLTIDNDGDYGRTSPACPGGANCLNEDSDHDGTSAWPPCTRATQDNDCDGRTNEDGDTDPVVYWRLTDGAGKMLTPLKGCLKDPNDSTHPASPNSELCEKDFSVNSNGVLAVTLLGTTTGLNASGTPQTIDDFITKVRQADATAKLQAEFMLVAPLERTISGGKKIPIQNLDFQVTSIGNNSTLVPLPVYTIKSDGYYKNFKQSITTYLTPRSVTPLFDFTIIQQQ